MIWDVIIVGGGPAGLSSAVHLLGKKVLLLEKKDRLGTKLSLSGAGQCNITHAGELMDFEARYNNWRFVRYALSEFSNKDLMAYFDSKGLKFVSREDGKYFPETFKSEDVIDVLKKELSKGIEFNMSETVKKISKNEVFTVETDKSIYKSRTVIVATGGHGYPKTGSTGDGINFAKQMGIGYDPYRYALSPIYLENHVFSALMGMSFKDAQVNHYRGKKIGCYTGDLLLTHFGYSGPVVLNASRHMRSGDTLHINFVGMNREALQGYLLREIEKGPKKLMKTILYPLSQARFIDEILKVLQLSETKASDLKKKDRHQLIKLLVDFEILIDQVGKSHTAMVSAGGISTKSLNKKTYESKVNGLYFIGECVDIDGDTGGYNIQYAFSSGVVAARHIRRQLDE